ncbi:MAG: helix-turn-helix transcriptional regulator [Candidatus Thorarchaeota archaeon]|nr:helix-turn-helix transcriptional regulator [Candidatus Thorarchaeota archaeon]
MGSNSVRTRESAENCPVFLVTKILGKRWAILILQELLASKNPKGAQFGELYRKISWVSPKILTQRLRELEKEGIVERIVDASIIPAHVHYELTEKGLDFAPILDRMQEWGIQHGGNKTMGCLGHGIASCSECTY